MAEVVLDANIIVGWLDQADAHNTRATELVEALKRDGHVALLLDVFVAEAVPVICRACSGAALEIDRPAECNVGRAPMA